MTEIYAIALVLGVIFILLLGFPVAFSLAGSALLFAFIGWLLGDFDIAYLGAFPSRLYGIMGNQTLLAVPLFIFMGVLLERSKISEELLESMANLFGNIRGGLGVSVFIVGAFLAASTGIVGATVVTMGLISLPAMLKYKYNKSLATGIVVASGSLGQIIPPSIVLIILGDQISSAYQQSLLSQGLYSGDTVSVGDLFAGAFFPGLILVFIYIMYTLAISYFKKDLAPSLRNTQEIKKTSLKELCFILVPPLLLILSVLGSIFIGLATPTEAASVGCLGAFLLSLVKKKMNKKVMEEVISQSMSITSMVFMILIGASLFSLIFRAYGGDELVAHFLQNLPGGKWTAFLAVMLLIFFLGFFLDFFEITFVVVPIAAPILLSMGMNPIWLGVMIALNLQTSFLTPPFGFSLFYLRGVAPKEIHSKEIYKGAIPFIGIQLFLLFLLVLFPELTTYLPNLIYKN